MSKFLKILSGLACIAILAVSSIFYFTADMVSAVDDFLASAKSKDVEKAYSFLSDGFIESTSKHELKKFLNSNTLASYQESSWASRSISGGLGNLVGSITTEQGEVVPIAVTLIKDQDGWKIYAIQKPEPGIRKDPSPTELPSETEQIDLVNKTMSVFYDSTQENSMEKLHQHASYIWRQQVSVEKLNEIYGPFLTEDLIFLNQLPPIFKQQPFVNENGLMVIDGYYSTNPDQFHFKQLYLYEGLGWKLVGLHLNLKKA